MSSIQVMQTSECAITQGGRGVWCHINNTLKVHYIYKNISLVNFLLASERGYNLSTRLYTYGYST